VDLRDIVRGARKLGVSTVSFQTSSVAGKCR